MRNLSKKRCNDQGGVLVRTIEFAKISKDILRQLSKAIEVTTTDIVLKQTGTSEDLYIEPKLMHEYAKVVSQSSNTAYSFQGYPKPVLEEVTKVKTFPLSKSQILQFIFYHFLPIEFGRFICNVSEQDIADKLGCSIRTVRNNNILFQELGLIDFSRSGRNINILLINYENYFKDGSQGYMQIAYSRFETMMKNDTVNALRQDIRQELLYDSYEIRRIMKKEETPCKISFNDYKTFAPAYRHYKAKIEENINKASGVFKTIFKDNYIFFAPTKSYKNGKHLKVERDAEYLDTIMDVLEINQCRTTFKHDDIRDLIQLSHEYSINTLTQVLKQFIDNYISDPSAEEINNFGGKIRVMIRMELANKNQPQAPAELMA